MMESISQLGGLDWYNLVPLVVIYTQRRQLCAHLAIFSSKSFKVDDIVTNLTVDRLNNGHRGGEFFLRSLLAAIQASSRLLTDCFIYDYLNA